VQEVFHRFQVVRPILSDSNDISTGMITNVLQPLWKDPGFDVPDRIESNTVQPDLVQIPGASIL